MVPSSLQAPGTGASASDEKEAFISIHGAPREERSQAPSDDEGHDSDRPPVPSVCGHLPPSLHWKLPGVWVWEQAQLRGVVSGRLLWEGAIPAFAKTPALVTCPIRGWPPQSSQFCGDRCSYGASSWLQTGQGKAGSPTRPSAGAATVAASCPCARSPIGYRRRHGPRLQCPRGCWLRFGIWSQLLHGGERAWR